MRDPDDIRSEMARFHRDKVREVRTSFSDIAGRQFEGEFNVSGFHADILALPSAIGSMWGIDRCLRIQEVPDSTHSFLFHMGIFARSVDLGGDFSDPFKDSRFHSLQKEVISQFLQLLAELAMDVNQLETTYMDEIVFGGTAEGRDASLRRAYRFPSDHISRECLRGHGIVIPVKSIANLDISPVEGALVGPRLEVAYRGIEVATVVFNCFKIHKKILVPINYVAGYAIGMERLVAALQDKHFLTSIPRYQNARKILTNLSQAASSSLLEKETMTVIYGAEALAHLPKALSRHQKERVRILRKGINDSLKSLGLHTDALERLTSLFAHDVVI